MDTITFTIPGRLPGLNEYTAANRSNPFVGAKVKKEVEKAISNAITAAQLKPIEGPVFVHILWVEQNRKRDPDNVASAKKFILDALVSGGIFPGDGQKWVLGFTDEFAVDKNNPCITVTARRHM